MIHITSTAVEKLKGLIADHPEDAIVRLTLMDLDDRRFVINITLEDRTQPDDEVQEYGDLTIAVAGSSVPRMNGVTLDYREPGGFKFLHPPSDEDALPLISLN